MRRTSLHVLAIVALACGPVEVETRLVALPDGGSISLEEIEETITADGRRALLLRYRTELDLMQTSALQAEIDSIWKYFRPEVEGRRMQVAVIRAVRWEKPSWERKGRAVEFVIERSPSGQWAIRDEPARSK